MKKRYRIFWIKNCREMVVVVWDRLIGAEVYREDGSHCIYEILEMK